MKKRCLLAALLFILLASAARAQEKNVVFFDSLTDEAAEAPAVQSAQVHQGALYAVADGVLYRCRPDAAEAEALIDLAQQDISDPYLHALLASDGETLLLLDTQARIVYAVDVQQRSLAQRHAFTGAQAAVLQELVMPVCYEGELFALNETWGYPHTFELVHANLETGAVRSAVVDGLKTISRYRDGMVLAFIREAERPGAICTLNRSGEIVDVLCELPMATDSIAAYDEATDTIYVYDGAFVSVLGQDGRLSQRQPLIKTYARSITYGGVLSSDAYVLLHRGRGLLVCPLSGPGLEKPIIRIEGTLADEAVLSRAAAETTDAAVVWQRRAPYTAEEIAQLIRTGDDSVDIFGLSASVDLGALIDRGFVLPLSSEAIREGVGSMVPGAQALLSPDGTPCAVPNYVRLHVMGVNAPLLAQYGLEPPATLDAYLDLYAAHRRLVDDPEGFFDWGMVFNSSDQMYFLNLLLRQYLLELGPDAQPDFQDENFVRVLRRICALDSGPLDWPEPIDSRLYENAFLNTAYAFEPQEASIRRYELDAAPMPALTARGDTPVRAELGVYVLNPCGKNVEAAEHVLEGLLRNLPLMDAYLLYPTMNEPTAFADYEAVTARLLESRAEEEARLASASEQERQDVLHSLAFIDAYLAEVELQAHWLVSPEDVARIRALTPLLDFEKGVYERLLLDAGQGSPLTAIFDRLFSGCLSLEQALLELRAKVDMMAAESAL